MPEEQLNAFIECFKADPSLRARINAASPEEVLVIAKELGFEIKVDDIITDYELDDDELEVLAGGRRPLCTSPATYFVSFTTDCGCG